MRTEQANASKRLVVDFDWFAPSMFLASIATYTYEFWWITRWFGFG